MAAAKFAAVGVKSVGAGIERRKAKAAVSGSGCASFSTGGLVAEDDGDAGERRRMQIGKAAGK